MSSRFHGILALVLAWPVAAPTTARPTSEQARPNVLVLVTNDLSRYDLEHIPTPHLDQLAAWGVSFENAWCHPAGSPTRHAIQFGRHGGRDEIGSEVLPRRAPGNRDVDNPSSPATNLSLAKLAKAVGHATATFGKWHLANSVQSRAGEAPRIHGYDTAHAISLYDATSPKGAFTHKGWVRIDDGAKSVEPVFTTRAQADALLAWIGSTSGPWLAHLSFGSPHAPFIAPPQGLLPAGYMVGPSDRERYEAMIMAMDTKIGEILDAVSLEETVVFFTSDGGPPLPGPGQDAARIGGTLFEHGINVPFLAAGPGIAKGGLVSPALVHSADLLATIAELLRTELPRDRLVDSTSFAGSLAQPESPGARRFLFSERFFPNGPGPRSEWGCAVRDARYKLTVVDDDGDGPQHSRRGLYDLAADPQEARPLDLGALTREQLQAANRLEAFLRAVIGSY